jgi:1,4-alpha-glucan branching enzyme
MQTRTDAKNLERPPGLNSARTNGRVGETIKRSAEAKEQPAQSKEKSIQLKLTAPAAQSVAAAGTFNNWDAKKTPLKKTGSTWTTSLSLPAGRYEYRFVVDGQWISDPAARESAVNPYGGQNSVLTI